MPRGEVAILSACIQHPNGLRREQLTVLTGYKRSTRDACIQRLRERGYRISAVYAGRLFAAPRRKRIGYGTVPRRSPRQ